MEHHTCSKRQTELREPVGSTLVGGFFTRPSLIAISNPPCSTFGISRKGGTRLILTILWWSSTCLMQSANCSSRVTLPRRVYPFATTTIRDINNVDIREDKDDSHRIQSPANRTEVVRKVGARRSLSLPRGLGQAQALCIDDAALSQRRLTYRSLVCHDPLRCACAFHADARL